MLKYKCRARCLTFLVPLSTANMLFDVRNVAKNISIRFIFRYSSFGVLLSEVEDANQLRFACFLSCLEQRGSFRAIPGGHGTVDEGTWKTGVELGLCTT